jgi:hypothetical protein
MPEFLVLGPFDPGARTGPSIWLRCLVDRALSVPSIPTDRPPILYLPGVGRQNLRAGEDCPAELQPLVELMYRGALWLQKSGHDWSVTAFISSDMGLGLDMARDSESLAALHRALPEFAEAPLSAWRGRRLQAGDFDRLLMSDVVRDLLLWMGEPGGFRVRIGAERWGAFRNECRTRFGLDPETDDVTSAGENLGMASGAWAAVWARFEEAPHSYGRIPDLLRRSQPTDRLVEPAHWPKENDVREESLRGELARLDGMSRAAACEKILDLEKAHGRRRHWVWARLNLAPLASVLEPLAVVASRAKTTPGGSTPDEIARYYVDDEWWRADVATWRALALSMARDERLVHEVLHQILQSWLDDAARVFQAAVESHPLPSHSRAETVAVRGGGCVMFVDGLRYDVGRVLAERLEARGCRVVVGQRWAALPTLTATGKPAVAPVADEIRGAELPADFTPRFEPGNEPADAAHVRAALVRRGYELVSDAGDDAPATEESRGWIEVGDIDSLGHDLEVGLARQIDDQVDRIADRIVRLLDAGWNGVRVVTDHGWLLLPASIRKVDLPQHLTANRCARCASLSGDSRSPMPTAPWHWNVAERFATAPGVSCFVASRRYVHGGLSIQECLTPDLFVERSGSRDVGERATIRSVTWRGMRCFVEAEVTGSGITVDLRLERSVGASVVKSLKPLDADGAVSLVLADDSHERADLVLVLLGSDGSVLAQKKTRVGSSS